VVDTFAVTGALWALVIAMLFYDRGSSNLRLMEYNEYNARIYEKLFYWTVFGAVFGSVFGVIFSLVVRTLNVLAEHLS